MANIEAGNDDQILIKSLVESYRLRISSSKGPNCLCAISTIESIYHRYGLNTLDRTLRLCVASWEGEPDSLTANIIKGIALLVTAFGDNLRDDLFQEKVGKFSAREVSRSARERKMGSMGYAEVMLAFYNKKTRYPLRWAQLHELQSQHTNMIRNTGVDEPDELEENASSAHTGSDSM